MKKTVISPEIPNPVRKEKETLTGTKNTREVPTLKPTEREPRPTERDPKKTPTQPTPQMPTSNSFTEEQSEDVEVEEDE
ncbi:MAG TPA: hypothetical protein VJ508_03310 [Saprospiraceae bacterium]|nr:hypothetical protein [Saprospiraceae bacterium]